MSIKIYNAYEWTGDYVSLIKTLNELKTKYISDCINRVSRLYTFDTISDVNQLYNHMIKDSFQNEKCHLYDVSLSCMVYIHKEKIVIQFFGINSHTYPTVYNFLEQLPDFSYWNNSDGPEDVSEEAFEDRGKWFNDLFYTYGSNFCECGLIYDYGTDTNIWNIAECSYEQWRIKNETK